MSEATAVQKKPETPLDAIRSMLEFQKDAIAQILPKTLSPERMVKLAIVAASKNAKLLECTKESFVLAFMQCVELGLEPNSPLGLAYLIPYYNAKTKKTEVQFQLGYKGLLALIRRSDEVGSVNAYAVHKNDKFSISLGDSPHIDHEPTIDGDPGELIGAYMVAELKSGQKEREWMTRAEILKVKSGSQAVQAGIKFGFKTPWDTSEGEMFRKTVLKRGGKRLPISTEVAEIIERENETDYAGYNAIKDLPQLPPMPREIDVTDKEPAPVLADPNPDHAPLDDLWDEAVALGVKLGRTDRVSEDKANAAMKEGESGMRSLIASLKELAKASGKE
jgi:recombination protein RecT